MAQHDRSLLEAALVGYELGKLRIEQSIADIQRRLGIPGLGPLRAATRPEVRKTHRISAEGRKRIAEAQRRRWAAAKRSQ